MGADPAEDGVIRRDRFEHGPIEEVGQVAIKPRSTRSLTRVLAIVDTRSRFGLIHGFCSMATETPRLVAKKSPHPTDDATCGTHPLGP